MSHNKNLGLWSLVGIIVGSMIGAGAFSLPSDMASGANTGAILLGWLITGIGMIALVNVYQNLALRKPELEGGIYSYARDGFGDYIGFNAAWGYWLSAWLGNVSYSVLLFGALSYFFPVFKGGNNLPSIIGASIFIWSINALVLRGIREAAIVNIITTIAKLVPIIIFVVILIFAFNLDVFNVDFWGEGDFSFGNVFEQVRSTMLVTLWVFIGIEGAVVVSSRARNRKDIGRATAIGLLGTLTIYLLVSGLALGIMPRTELASLKNPSMAYVLEYVVGSWGAKLISIGLIISLLGATLGWTLLFSEIPYIVAKDGLFPKIFAKENKKGSPSNSLYLTIGLIQIFLIITLFSNSTYQALYFIAGTTILLPYLFSSLYQLKITWTGNGYEHNESGKRRKDFLIALGSSLYGIWLVYAAGLDYLLMAAILYAFGIFFYYWAKKERKEKLFKSYELILALGIIVAALIAIILIVQGVISPL